MQFPFSKIRLRSAAALLAFGLSAQQPHAGPEKTNRFGGNLQLVGLTYHPGGGSFENYPRKIDDRAVWVILLGGQADADWYAHEYALIRASVSLNKDCMDVWSGFLHLGPRLNLPIGPRFVFRVGIGPTLVWRENWAAVLDDYTRDGFYGDANGKKFQSKFLWYGGNVDFEWKLRENFSFLYSNVPGLPFTVTSAIGARYSF